MANDSDDQSSQSAKAPVSLTGGGGYRFENMVAARLLLDMLGQTNVFGPEFGTLVRIDWQARDTGWLADDIAASFAVGGTTRSAGLSIKSGQSVTTKGFPSDFVSLAWDQWNQAGTQRSFKRSSDVLALVTGNGKTAAVTPWSDLLKEILAGDPERIVQRLNSTKEEGVQFSVEKREIASSFKPSAHASVPATEVVELIKQVRWTDFDFESPASRDAMRAVADCKSVLNVSHIQDAETLWKRLIEISDELRPLGGFLTLAKLYERLKEFSFKAKPEIDADWQALDRRSNPEMDAIKSVIANLPSLDRKEHREQITAALKSGVCIAVGESGSGKSALAKEIANQYEHRIWLNADSCDQPSLLDLEKFLGLANPLPILIGATPGNVCVVFDALEGFGGSALKIVAQSIGAILSSESPVRAKFILTSQAGASSTVLNELLRAGLQRQLLNVVQVDRPEEQVVRDLVKALPQVGWIALSPEIRSLLRNLKMLDWFVAFAQGGGVLGSTAVGLTNLIDSLWNHWVATGDEKFAREDLLRTVATIEADRHIASVPVSDLVHGQKLTLGKVIGDDLLRVQNNRVKFSHDLISDWARLNALLDGEWFKTGSSRERYLGPRWSRAVRLFGQRLLEQGNDGGESWRQHIHVAQDGTNDGTLIRDLFLEALFLAPNSRALLEQAWPTLSADRGKLLNVMLQRFLFVATYPDPLLALVAEDGEDISQYEHLMRIPYWPYWGPVIEFLHVHTAEIVEYAPVPAAKICGLWLRKFQPPPGKTYRWRKEAGDLALAIGRKIQSYNEQGNYYSAGADKDVFDAVFQAAPELPQEIGQYCLEMAKRRPLAPEIAAEVVAARAEREAERKKQAELNPAPNRRSFPPDIFSLRGNKRPQWPDGPSSRVDDEFQESILDGGSFVELAKANPDAALETLLAICIEEPKDEYHSHSGLGDLGVVWWHKGEPPGWFRGPFFALLKFAPAHGITFVIKLANFVTSQYQRQGGLTLNVDGGKKLWRGDDNLFAAHYDGYLSHGSILQSALMALEKWFYDRIDAKEDITADLSRIMSESESIAFAGVLTAVGKYKPSLLFGPLKPLVESWELWGLDSDLTLQRVREMGGPMGLFRNEGPRVWQLLKDWAVMPHRKEFLRNIMTVTFLPRDEYRGFFSELRKTWRGQLEGKTKPEHLFQLIAVIDPDNYKYEIKDGAKVPVEFSWPEGIRTEAEKKLKASNDRAQLLTFPTQCRKLLDEGKNLSGEPLDEFFATVQGFHKKKADRKNLDNYLYTYRDLVFAGVAVLLVLGYDWLEANPKKLSWCLDRLKEELKQPEFRAGLLSDTNIGNDKRDAFTAECAVALLARDPKNPLARKLTARSLLALFYSTTNLTMARAFSQREALGDDFKRMIHLVVEWSAIRSKINATSPSLSADLANYHKQAEALKQAFISRTMPASLPDIPAINAKTMTELGDLYLKGHPEHAAYLKAQKKNPKKDREKPSVGRIGLDERLLMAAFSWLDIGKVELPSERTEFFSLIRALLGLVLGQIPEIDPEQRELQGYPSDFDSWVYKTAAITIVRMSDDERPELLWQPILQLPPPAHSWIERFFWEWFTTGYGVQNDASVFFSKWRQMVEFALVSPNWDPKARWHHRLDDMVKELLGFNPGWAWIKAPGVEAHIPGLADLYERAAEKWFYLPDVLTGFLYFAQKSAASCLAIKSIPWIAKATRGYSKYSWDHGTDDALVAFLAACWRLDAKQITSDQNLRADFFQLVNAMAARQGHAAIALRDRIARETQG